MAVKTDAEYFEFASTSKQTPSLSSEINRTKKLIPFYKAKSAVHVQSGKIIKPKGSSLNWFSKSLIVHLQKPEFLHSHCVLKKNNYYKHPRLMDSFAMQDSEMNEVGSICLKKKLPEFTNSRFTVNPNTMDDSMLSADIESDSPIEQISPRFNSPVDHSSSQSSKSQSSIEDLNKEIEKLFLNNTEKYGFSSFVWDREEIAEGRRAPVADMLTSYKAENRKKKRRSATALGIRNYTESDSSNGMSSPDEHSGCEEYCKMDSVDKSDPPIIIPVPVGKSSMDQLDTTDFGRPFSGSKLHFSEDSAFAPIRSIQRSQSTPPQNTIDMIEDRDDKNF